MKVLFKRGLEEKTVKFSNEVVNSNNSVETIVVNHSCDIDDVLKIKLPTNPYIYTNNKLIIGLYGLLPYFIEQLKLINEQYFELKFIENDEYIYVNFRKLFERKTAENYYNIEYSLSISFHMFLTNFRNNNEYLINRQNISELSGFKPNKVITIQNNGNDDYYIFSNKIIHEIVKIISNNNIFN